MDLLRSCEVVKCRCGVKGATCRVRTRWINLDASDACQKVRVRPSPGESLNVHSQELGEVLVYKYYVSSRDLLHVQVGVTVVPHVIGLVLGSSVTDSCGKLPCPMITDNTCGLVPFAVCLF